MEREMNNINANLIKEPVSTSFFKDGRKSQVVNFTLAKTFAKGDFVHVYGYFNHRMKDGKTYKNFIVQSLNKIEKKEN